MRLSMVSMKVWVIEVGCSETRADEPTTVIPGEQTMRTAAYRTQQEAEVQFDADCAN